MRVTYQDLQVSEKRTLFHGAKAAEVEAASVRCALARTYWLVGCVTGAPSRPSPWKEVERQDRRYCWFPRALKGMQALLSVVAHSATSQVTAPSDESASLVSMSEVWSYQLDEQSG